MLVVRGSPILGTAGRVSPKVRQYHKGALGQVGCHGDGFAAGAVRAVGIARKPFPGTAWVHPPHPDLISTLSLLGVLCFRCDFFGVILFFGFVKTENLHSKNRNQLGKNSTIHKNPK